MTIDHFNKRNKLDEYILKWAILNGILQQGWNSEFGSNKERKKLKQGKEKRLLARKKDC